MLYICKTKRDIPTKTRAMNANTLKAGVRKANPNCKVVEVKKHNWGLFTVKVTKEMPRSTKVGLVFGSTDGDQVTLEKVNWV